MQPSGSRVERSSRCTGADGQELVFRTRDLSEQACSSTRRSRGPIRSRSARRCSSSSTTTTSRQLQGRRRARGRGRQRRERHVPDRASACKIVEIVGRPPRRAIAGTMIGRDQARRGRLNRIVVWTSGHSRRGQLVAQVRLPRAVAPHIVLVPADVAEADASRSRGATPTFSSRQPTVTLWRPSVSNAQRTTASRPRS